MNVNINQPQTQREFDNNTRKIESKDSMWKPAPIIGREMTMGSQEPKLTTTQQLQKLREQAMQQEIPQQPNPNQGYIHPQEFENLRKEKNFEEMMAHINQK